MYKGRWVSSLFHVSGRTYMAWLLSAFATALRRRLNFEPLSARQDRANCWRWQEWLWRHETCKLDVSVLIFTAYRCVSGMTRFTVTADTRANGGRSQLQRGLRLMRAAARFLGLRVRIPPGHECFSLCVVRSLQRTDPSSRIVLPSVCLVEWNQLQL